MYGIASLLDPPHYAKIEAIWQELDAACGLNGVSITPYPHFTWQIADGYDLERARSVLAKAVQGVAPFMVRTTGLGIFTGPTPVVFLSIVKNEFLLAFHKYLWEEMQPVADKLSPFYAPILWVPHITLVYGDITPANLDCAMQKLAFRSYDWEIKVDHLALACQPAGEKDWDFCRFEFER